jgi:hypothetical protein
MQRRILRVYNLPISCTGIALQKIASDESFHSAGAQELECMQIHEAKLINWEHRMNEKYRAQQFCE